MGTGQMPPEYEGRPGWKPNLQNLEAIQRADPEGYQLIMKKRMKDQRKREDARVGAFYKIDEIFSNYGLGDYLDEEALKTLYEDFVIIKPDVKISDLKKLLHEAMKKGEVKFEELDKEDWELTKKLMGVQAELDRYSGHLDPKYKAVAQEIDKVRRVKDDKRENLRRLEALIKSFNDATIDDQPLKGLVDFIHDRVKDMNERKGR